MIVTSVAITRMTIPVVAESDEIAMSNAMYHTMDSKIIDTNQPARAMIPYLKTLNAAAMLIAGFGDAPVLITTGAIIAGAVFTG